MSELKIAYGSISKGNEYIRYKHASYSCDKNINRLVNRVDSRKSTGENRVDWRRPEAQRAISRAIGGRCPRPRCRCNQNGSKYVERGRSLG